MISKTGRPHGHAPLFRPTSSSSNNALICNSLRVMFAVSIGDDADGIGEARIEFGQNDG
jgi:hypothetical protein